MTSGRSSMEACRRLVVAWMLTLFLAPKGGATEAAAPAPLPEGETGAQTASSSAAGAVDLDRILDQALPSIFLVETETWRGVGFLADSSGLIVTPIPAARPARYLAVTLAPGRKVAARPVDDSNSPYGIIQVNPEMVAGLRPLPMTGPPDEARPEAEGDPLVAIFLSPEGGFIHRTGVITKGGGSCPHADLPLPSEPGSCVYASRCACWPVQCTTGVVLDSRGRVIGLNPFLDNKHPPRTRIVRVPVGSEILAAALAKVEQTQPPAPSLLATVPTGPYPREAPDQRTAARPDLGLYQKQAGPFLVEFLTPSLARPVEERKEEEGEREGEDVETGQAVPCSRATGDRDRWRAGFSDGSPVVTVRVFPELRRRAGTYVGVSAFWIFSPVIYTTMVLGGASPGPPPHVSYRFDPAIRDIELLRGDKKVEPIRPERVCGVSGGLLNIDLCPPGSQERDLRRTKGCYVSYTYLAEAFAPGEPVELRIFAEGAPECDPVVVALDDALLMRIHSDFPSDSEVVGAVGSPPDPFFVPDRPEESPR